MATLFNIIQSDAVGGGMENIFLEYSKIIQKHQDKIGTKLICLVSKNFCHLKAIEKENIKIEILNIKGHFDIFAAIKLHFLIRKYSPNLIMTHNGRSFSVVNLYNKIFKFKKKFKTLAVSHGGRIKRLLNFDLIICVAKHIENKILEANFKGNSIIIYNGYKTSSFKKKAIKRDNFVFGTLSRLSKEKDVLLAITAFNKFIKNTTKDSALIIAGEGIEKKQLEQKVKDLGLQDKVKFIGWIKNQEDFFGSIDIFLQPAFAEPFGITILESFNYQTPVIAANSFGPKEIIEHKLNGYLFEPKDENSLFETMKKSYLEKDKFPEITTNAKKTLEEKFSYEIMEKNLVGFLTNAISS